MNSVYEFILCINYILLIRYYKKSNYYYFICAKEAKANSVVLLCGNKNGRIWAERRIERDE